jgi:hypothetical protein
MAPTMKPWVARFALDIFRRLSSVAFLGWLMIGRIEHWWPW